MGSFWLPPPALQTHRRPGGRKPPPGTTGRMISPRRKAFAGACKHCLAYTPTGRTRTGRRATAGAKIPTPARTLTPRRSLLAGPHTARDSPRTYADDHGTAASPLQHPIRRTLSPRNGPSARNTLATDLALARLSYGSHQFVEVTSIQHRKSSCSTSDVLDSLHA
jgi:hypothetical protein